MTKLWTKDENFGVCIKKSMETWTVFFWLSRFNKSQLVINHSQLLENIIYVIVKKTTFIHVFRKIFRSAAKKQEPPSRRLSVKTSSNCKKPNQTTKLCRTECQTSNSLEKAPKLTEMKKVRPFNPFPLDLLNTPGPIQAETPKCAAENYRRCGKMVSANTQGCAKKMANRSWRKWLPESKLKPTNWATHQFLFLFPKKNDWKKTDWIWNGTCKS